MVLPDIYALSRRINNSCYFSSNHIFSIVHILIMRTQYIFKNSVVLEVFKELTL